jgi:SAM-dependent methyltransferase
MKLEVVLINILVFLFFLFILRYYVSTCWENQEKEGFVQKESFLLKREQDIYDDFYASVYDQIFVPLPRIQNCINALLQTEPYSETNVFLDIGSGTGIFANALYEKGFNVCGIDSSEAMMDYSQKKYPSITFIEGDVTIPMQFEPNSFTHICCVDFTIYLFSDKSALFQNIYSWLTPGGYLCLHLVDPENFPTIFSSRKYLDILDLQKYLPKTGLQSDKDTIITSIEFDDFYYKYNYEIQSNTWKWVETFTDKKTKHVRQNERTLFMDSIEHILFLAEKNGFKWIPFSETENQNPYFICKKI